MKWFLMAAGIIGLVAYGVSGSGWFLAAGIMLAVLGSLGWALSAKEAEMRARRHLD